MCFRLMGVGGEDAGWTQPMTGEAMRIREGATASERRLFQDDREIGYIRGATVGFVGFTTEADAVEAAHSADRALERRRSRAGWLASTIGGATVAQLVRVEAAPGTVWGFEVTLRAEERVTVFAMSRARTMWNALRASGLAGRMRQFHDPVVAQAGRASMSPSRDDS